MPVGFEWKMESRLETSAREARAVDPWIVPEVKAKEKMMWQGNKVVRF
jgi:hypothetical protein